MCSWGSSRYFLSSCKQARSHPGGACRYNKVVNIPNSMTVLPELVPVAIEMSKRKLTGIMNYTNPGAISHNEILELYKEYIDPEFTWENFNIEEQVCHNLFIFLLF